MIICRVNPVPLDLEENLQIQVVEVFLELQLISTVLIYITIKGKLVKHVQQFATNLTTVGTRVPSGITQCYLPPGRGDIIPTFTFTPAN